MLDAIKQHKQKYINVLNELEALHYPQLLEWRHNKNKLNTENNILTRIKSKRIINIPLNKYKCLTYYYYEYFYTPKQLDILYY